MNFVAATPGGIGLPQLVHVANVIVDDNDAFSVIKTILSVGSVIVRPPYILYVCAS